MLMWIQHDCYSDSKSYTGVSIHLGKYSGAFLILSKTQTITTVSSIVATFVAAHLARQKNLWAQNLLFELGFNSSIPTTLYQDNMSTIRLILHKGNSGELNILLSDII